MVDIEIGNGERRERRGRCMNDWRRKNYWSRLLRRVTWRCGGTVHELKVFC